MGLIKRIINWFRGTPTQIEEQPIVVIETNSQPVVKKAVKAQEAAADELALLRTAPQEILKELKELKPPTQMVNEARRSLIDELKRLAPRRKKAH